MPRRFDRGRVADRLALMRAQRALQSVEQQLQPPARPALSLAQEAAFRGQAPYPRRRPAFAEPAPVPLPSPGLPGAPGVGQVSAAEALRYARPNPLEQLARRSLQPLVPRIPAIEDRPLIGPFATRVREYTTSPLALASLAVPPLRAGVIPFTLGAAGAGAIAEEAGAPPLVQLGIEAAAGLGTAAAGPRLAQGAIRTAERAIPPVLRPAEEAFALGREARPLPRVTVELGATELHGDALTLHFKAGTAEAELERQVDELLGRLPRPPPLQGVEFPSEMEGAIDARLMAKIAKNEGPAAARLVRGLQERGYGTVATHRTPTSISVGTYGLDVDEVTRAFAAPTEAEALRQEIRGAVQEPAISLAAGEPPPPRPPRGRQPAEPPVTPPPPPEPRAQRVARSSIAQPLARAYNAVARPAANWPADVRAWINELGTDYANGYLDAELMTRQMQRHYQAAGLRTGAEINAVRGGKTAPTNLKGTLADIIENADDYTLNAAQRRAVTTEQDARRLLLDYARKEGVDIGEVEGNYFRHMVEVEGGEQRAIDAARRFAARQPVTRRRKFATLRELQAWLDANPDIGGRIATVDWEVAAQSSLEQVGRAVAEARLMRKVAPQRWVRPRKGGLRALPPEGYRRVNLPGFEGKTVVIKDGEKTVTTRVGDWYLPDASASALESQLGAAPAGLQGAAEALEAFRGTMLNLDASIGVMFSAFKWFGDPVGSMLQARSWARAIPTSEGFAQLIEGRQDLVRLFHKGGGRLGLSRAAQFGEEALGRQPLHWLERIPVVGKGLAYANRLQFQRIMGATKLLFFESHLKALTAMRSLGGKLKIPRISKWTDDEIVRGAAQAAMNQTLSIDTAAIGLGHVRRFAERLTFLTPGFLRGAVGLFAKTPSALWGDPQGIAQAIFLTQFIGTASAATAALSWAFTGEWSDEEHFDPRSSKFLTIETPWGRVSPTGQIRTYSRLLANLPEDIMEDNLQRTRFFLESRESQPLRELYAQITGRDLMGEPVGTEAFTEREIGPPVVSRAIAAAERMAPISLGAAARAVGERGLAPETAEAVLASAAGLTFWPLRIRERLDTAAQERFDRPWRELETFERDAVMAANPELQADAEEDLRDRVRRGDAYAVRQDLRESTFDDFNRLVSAVPEASPERRQWREEYSTLMAQQSAALAALDRLPEFRDIADRLAKREPATPEQALIREWQGIFERNRDPATGAQSAAQREQMTLELDDFERSHAAQMEIIDRNSGLRAPDWVKKYRADRNEIADSGWWDMEDKLWQEFVQPGVEAGTVPPAAAQASYRQNLAWMRQALIAQGTQPSEVALDQAFPILNDFERMATEQRRDWRTTNPRIDGLLVIWGYAERPYTAEAAQIIEQETGLQAIPQETTGGGLRPLRGVAPLTAAR